MISSIIKEHKKYKEDPTKNPTYSFKKELKELAKDGEITLKSPLTFTSENVNIVGFDVNGVKIKNNIINKSYSFRWEQLGFLFSRKLFELVK